MKKYIRLIWTAALLLAGVALGTVAVELIIGLWLPQPIWDAISATHASVLIKPDHKLSPEELRELSALVKTGAVLTQDQLLGHLNNFYQGLIQLLITILGLVGVIAYFYIRAVSLDQAEKAAQEKAEKLMTQKFEEKKFFDDLEKAVEKLVGARAMAINDVLEDLEELKPAELTEKLAQLERQITALSAAVASMDNEEEQDKDGIIEQ